MVRRAQNQAAHRPPGGRDRGLLRTDRMIVAVISALAWLNFGPQPALAFAIVSATTVLIVACPVRWAWPPHVGDGRVGKAAEAGVLIRNGEALQTALEAHRHDSGQDRHGQ